MSLDFLRKKILSERLFNSYFTKIMIEETDFSETEKFDSGIGSSSRKTDLPNLMKPKPVLPEDFDPKHLLEKMNMRFM